MMHDPESDASLNLVPWAPWLPHPSSGSAVKSRKKELVFSDHQPSARPHPLLVQSTNLKIQELRDELELCSKSFLPSFKGEAV